MTSGDIRFDGRAILVTGAGRGLGREQALLLASRGAKVVVADNGGAMDGGGSNSRPADAVVAEIKSAGGEAVACTADLASESGAAAAVEASVKAFGRIDGIAHNASTAPDIVHADAQSTHDLELVMRINPIAGIWMARAAWPHMVRQKYGRIVYMTSGGAYGAVGATAYGAAKAAQIGLMRCLALEGLQHGILVNAVAPSARTRMTEGFPPGPYADWFMATMGPEKVATGAAYLLSEACNVHGEIFVVAGGRVARMTLAESDGFVGAGESIEAVRDAMPRVMADTRFFHPKNLAERSMKVASLFGFKVNVQADAPVVQEKTR